MGKSTRVDRGYAGAAMARLGPRQGDGSSARRPRTTPGFWIACACLAAFKLWLVFPDEVVAVANPLDQQRFAEMADQLIAGRWLGPYDPLTLVREPGYPLFVAALHPLGAPLRLAAEAWLLFASLLFSVSLRRCGAGTGLCVAAFAAAALEPHGLLVQREVLPAGFYGATWLVALAGLFFALAAATPRRAAVHATWAGLAGGWLWITRPEQMLVALVFAAVAVLAALRARGARLRTFAATALPAFAGVAAVPLAVAAVNARHYGVFDSTEVRGAHYLAANRALTSIAQDAPRRFVPVPRESRERAYAVSPALAELRPALEGPSWARNVSCRIDRVCDDVAAGYFRWLLRDAAAAAGHGGSPADFEAYFARVAQEVEGACERGALPCRSGTAAFLHPVAGTYLAYLPRSFARIARRLASPGGPAAWEPAADHPATPPELARTFDRIANRRKERTHNGSFVVEGRARSPSDPVERVLLRSAHRPVAAASAVPGPDGAFAFRLEGIKTERRLATMAPALVLERASGSAVSVPVRRSGPVEQNGVRVVLERVEETGAPSPLRRLASAALWIAHAGVVAALALCALPAAVVLALPPWRRRAPDALSAAGLTLGLLVVARVALLTWVDASSFPARSSRYVYPVAALAIVAGLLLAQRAFVRLRRRRAAPSVPPG